MSHNSLHPGITLAEQLDTQGRHDDAINELALAAHAGNLEAVTRLGKRLFVGDKAPYMPHEGAGFILEAAAKGHAGALALQAIFQSTGIFQRKNWNDALVSLGHAAELGLSSAREQLLLLAQGPAGNERQLTADDCAGAWQVLVRRIDLAAWLQAPAGIPVHDDPLLKSFPAFLPPAFCARLMAQARTRLKPALVYDPVNKRDKHSGTRTNTVAQFNLVENELIHFVLQQRMASACGIPMTQFEATAILHYNPGEQIMNHYDFVDTDLPDYAREINENGQRIITFLVYLNDGYTAGETVFPKLDICHKGEAGEGFFFTNALEDGRPDHRVLHAGAPPQAAEKWIVSQFIRNRPVKYVL
jgi:prolyl 4-hydroxylase